jgi:hypothetical protein
MTRTRRLNRTGTASFIAVVFFVLQVAPAWVRFANGEPVQLLLLTLGAAVFLALGMYCFRTAERLARAA